MWCYCDRRDHRRGNVPAKRVFTLILIELSKHLAAHLPEQRNFIMYRIKQEEYGKKDLTREDRESKVNVLQC